MSITCSSPRAIASICALLLASTSVRAAEIWMQAAASAPWSERFSHASVVFNGKMWVIAGTFTFSQKVGDVWSSADGVSWAQIGSVGPRCPLCLRPR